MTRRGLMQALASVLPTSLAIRVEPEIQPADLLVIKSRELLPTRTIHRIREEVERLWPEQRQRPRVLVLGESLTLTVHRHIGYSPVAEQQGLPPTSKTAVVVPRE